MTVLNQDSVRQEYKILDVFSPRFVSVEVIDAYPFKKEWNSI